MGSTLDALAGPDRRSGRAHVVRAVSRMGSNLCCARRSGYALNAHAIATSGRGMSGEPWPLYFRVGGTFWATPLVVYWPALFLTGSSGLRCSGPAADSHPRRGLSHIDVLDRSACLYSERSALVAAALLATTPAFFLHSRLGVDHLYPVPLVLGWFLCVLRYLERGRRRDLFAAAVCWAPGSTAISVRSRQCRSTSR